MRLDPKMQPWMNAAETRAVMDALAKDGGSARFVGGVVRNALMGRPVSDIDIATPLTPDQVTKKLEAAKIRAVPTGIEHGTITAVVNGKTFEVTTLRRDVSTDGRRAVVAFTTDWKEDSERRDFTLNALYANTEGEIFDYHDGIADLQAGRVRFIGDPETRIREDYLRILRLFRFHAWYGKGPIDREAVLAAVVEREGLRSLSGERIAKEMLKLLEADDPSAVITSMAASAIFPEIMPGGWRLTRLFSLLKIEANNFFTPDPLLRLKAMIPSKLEAVKATADRWKLSNAQRARLEYLATAKEKIVSYLSVREVRKLLYRIGVQRFKDRTMLKWAEDPRDSNAIQWRALLAIADAWVRPVFPLTGANVMTAGVPQGPLVGEILADVEEWWIESDFIEDEFSIAERLKAVLQSKGY